MSKPQIGLTYSTTEIQNIKNLMMKDFSAHMLFTKLLQKVLQIWCSARTLYISSTMNILMAKSYCYGDIGSKYAREAAKSKLADGGVHHRLSDANHYILINPERRVFMLRLRVDSSTEYMHTV